MIEGRFGDTTGRPYIEGRLAIPRLDIFGDVSFIVDTGADKTVLMPLDCNRLKLDYSTLITPTQTVGIGGLSMDFCEPAILAFVDDGLGLCVYEEIINIATPHQDIDHIPSLLGRDIIDNWRLSYDKSNSHLSAEPFNADVIVPLNQ